MKGILIAALAGSLLTSGSVHAKLFAADTHKANVVALILVHRDRCKTLQSADITRILHKLQKEKAYLDKELADQMSAMNISIKMDADNGAAWCHAIEPVIENPAKWIEE